MKGGNVDSTSKNELRKYLLHALLKQTYGGHGDQVLSVIREVLRKEEDSRYVLRRKNFLFEDLVGIVKLPANKDLRIIKKDIEEILGYKKGPYTFMVLSLLYSNLKFGQVKFHQDHIHPASLFTEAKLRYYGIPEPKWRQWQSVKDELPNLQIMEGSENESKSKVPFKDWLYGKDESGYPHVFDTAKFLEDNYIPSNVSFDFEAFEAFFKVRKNLLREKIKKVLL